MESRNERGQWNPSSKFFTRGCSEYRGSRGVLRTPETRSQNEVWYTFLKSLVNEIKLHPKFYHAEGGFLNDPALKYFRAREWFRFYMGQKEETGIIPRLGNWNFYREFCMCIFCYLWSHPIYALKWTEYPWVWMRSLSILKLPLDQRKCVLWPIRCMKMDKYEASQRFG